MGKSRWWQLAALSIPALHASAQQLEQAATPAQVTVSGKANDTAARRDFVAGKIIIGRSRIEESGAQHVAELLKREPAVSVSADGRIGLNGLPGYTQVLVDGAPPESGKGLHQLNLVHVEKIEIVKSSIAEFGPFGIAGTINVITRKTARKTSTELGLDASASGGQPGASFSLSHNRSQAGSPFRLAASLSAGRSRPASASHSRLSSRAAGGAEQGIWEGATRSRARIDDVSANAELTWEPDARQNIRLSPNGGQMVTRAGAVETRNFAGGLATDTRIATRSTLRMANLPVHWTIKPDSLSQVEMRARASTIELEDTQKRMESTVDGTALRESAQAAVSRVKQLEVNYKAKLGKRHDVKLGASALQTRETIDFMNRIDGRADPAFDFLGAQRRARSQQTRVFAQDDWRVSDSLALNAGLSHQRTAIALDEGNDDSTSRYRLWSPSLHLVKNLGDDDTRQLRLSLARTYRAPDRGDLALRPRIHPLAPCSVLACGDNTIDTLDSAGNPSLRPERSLGLNMSYEVGIGDDSTLTAEVYARRIGDKIGTEITRGAVPWSPALRYVSRPANLGDAHVRGLNLEMELALQDLSETAPRAHLRGSINLATSRVLSLPGPDNRLDKQTPWSAKLGGSYSVPGWPVKIDLDASWSPGVWSRSNESKRIAIARRFDIDGSIAWTISPAKRLRLSVADLLARTAQSIYEYESAQGFVDLRTDTRKYRTFTIRLDTKL